MVGVLVAAVIIELIIIFGTTAYTRWKSKATIDFTFANRQMTALAIGCTVALTPLGTPGVLGVPGTFAQNGLPGALMFCLGQTAAVAMVLLVTGPIYRQLNLRTAPDMIQLQYGGTARSIVTCVTAATAFGGLCLETQGLGAIIEAMTGIPIAIGAAIGAIVGILYMILGGMDEISKVNIINSIILYASLILAAAIVVYHISQGNGVRAINNYYLNGTNANGESMAWMLSLFKNREVFVAVGLTSLFSQMFAHPAGNAFIHPCVSAPDYQTVRKAALFGIPINGLFGFFIILLSVISIATPEYAVYGGASVVVMACALLPKWVVTLLLVGFFGVILSTFTMIIMGSGSMFVNNIYTQYYNLQATIKQKNTAMRIWVIVYGIAAMGMASLVPNITGAANWTFAWSIPVLFIVIFGLFYRRNTKAAIANLVVCWIINMLWSFTPLSEAIGLGHLKNSNAIMILFPSIVLCFILPWIFKGGKPGLIKEIRESNLEKIQDEMGLAH